MVTIEVTMTSDCAVGNGAQLQALMLEQSKQILWGNPRWVSVQQRVERVSIYLLKYTLTSHVMADDMAEAEEEVKKLQEMGAKARIIQPPKVGP